MIPIEVVAFIPAIQLRLNKECDMSRREAEDMEQDEVGLVEQEIACLPTNLSREDTANLVSCNTSLLRCLIGLLPVSWEDECRAAMLSMWNIYTSRLTKVERRVNVWRPDDLDAG